LCCNERLAFEESSNKGAYLVTKYAFVRDTLRYI